MNENTSESRLMKVIDLLKSGSLEEYPGNLICPICGAEVDIVFHPSGKNASMSCTKNMTHFAWNGFVDSAPKWWPSRLRTDGWVKLNEE